MVRVTRVDNDSTRSPGFNKNDHHNMLKYKLVSSYFVVDMHFSKEQEFPVSQRLVPESLRPLPGAVTAAIYFHGPSALAPWDHTIWSKVSFCEKKNTIRTTIVRGSQKHSLGQSEGRESLKQMVKRTLLGFVLRWIIRLHFRESSGAWESKRELWKDYTNFHPTSAALKPLLQNLFSPRKDAIAFLQTLFLVGYCVHIEIMIHPCQAAFAGEPLIEPLMSVYGENSKVHLIREIISQIIKMEI